MFSAASALISEKILRFLKVLPKALFLSALQQAQQEAICQKQANYEKGALESRASTCSLGISRQARGMNAARSRGLAIEIIPALALAAAALSSGLPA